MTTRRIGGPLLLALLGWIILSGAASPPELIDYQGVLRDAMNNPLDGSFDMEFALYDADGGGTCAGGNLLLTDSHLAGGSGAITVTGGLFYVQLGGGTITPGASNGLAEAFRDNSDVYLEVQVDGDTLCPRIRMLSTAYSLNTESLDGAGADFYLSRDNHTGTQAPSTISPQGPGSGLDADTVGGMDSAELAGPSYSNYVVVAASGGDYTNPLDAMANLDTGDNWCGPPSPANRCLIRIMSGVYDLGAAVLPGALTMRSYVDIEGSGQSVTKLTAIGTDSLGGAPATVATRENAELRSLTVESSGGTAYANAIAGVGASRVSRLTNVTAIAGGGTSGNKAIVNQNTLDAFPVLRNVTAIASGKDATGIQNSCSAVDIDGAVVTASGTGTVVGIQDSNNLGNCGISVKGRITNAQVTADGGTVAMAVAANQSQTLFTQVALVARNGSSASRGVTFGSSSDFDLASSTIEADGSPTTEGLRSFGSGTVRVDHCNITAQTATINVTGSTGSILIGGTKLSGGAAVSSVPMTCAGVYDETNTFFANTCP